MSGLIALLTCIPLLLSVSVASATAGTLITTYGDLFSRNSRIASATIDVVRVERTPSQIEFLRYAPTGGTPMAVRQSDYSAHAPTAGPFVRSPMPTVYAGGPTLDLSHPVPLVPSTLFHESDAIFIRLTDIDQNLYPDQIDSILVTLTSTTGDTEVLRLYETTVDSGEFIGYIASAIAPATIADGKISIAVESIITASYTDIADQNDASASAGLFDPIGTVFDSTTGLPVNGVSITIIDTSTGLPATVFGDDGSSTYPSTVVSGGAVRDSSGRDYTFPPGGYRFPLMAPGTYRLDLQTPTGWSTPSTVPTVDLQSLPGAPWSILDPGSRGEPFILAPVPVLRMDIPIDPISKGLWVAKSAAKAVIAIGDFLPYQITVTNSSNSGNATDVIVTDHLPRGFRYRNGSARLDGMRMPLAKISSDGRTLTFSIGNLAPLQSRTISYVVEIAAGALPGEATNQASAQGEGGLGSNTAKATVKVREELLHSSALIVGQVLDGCGDEAQGIPGVRIYLEDGSFVITDQDGLYHFEGVRPIAHVVQLDTITLPSGYSPAPCEENTRFAGQDFSQFVELQGGTMWRADFYAAKPALTPAQMHPFAVETSNKEAYSASGLTGLQLTSTISEKRVRYRIEITNAMVAIQKLKLSVKLPAALSLLPGTTVVDDAAAQDPELAGEEYRFTLSDLSAEERHVVTFDADLPNGSAGEMVATTILGFDTTGREGLQTPAAVNRFVITRTTNLDSKDFVLATHFDSARTELKEIDAKALAEFAQIINTWKVERIELIGHTDSVRLSKKSARLYKDNVGLSRARATTIAQALTALLNIPGDRISSTGKGETEPIADNRREAGRAANRRVEVKIYLSKERIESSIEPALMDSGRQEIKTDAGLLRMPGVGGQTLPVVEIADSAVPAAATEKKTGVLSPADNAVLPTEISAVRIKIDSRLKPVLLLDGVIVPADRIGFTMVDKESKSTLYSYIGVNFGEPGTHQLLLRGIDPFGNTRFEETSTIIRSGAVASISVVEDGMNVADGKTPVRVRVELRDAAGQVIPAGITLTIKEGNLLPPRATAPIDQTQLNTESLIEIDRDGWVAFRPVAQSGAYRTRLVYDDEVAIDIETYVKPQMRDWILVGIGEGTIGYNRLSGNMEALAAEDVEDAYYDDGRIAFFAKGKIKGEWLLTAAYDSAKKKQDKLHGTIDPDQYYMLYGDGTDQQYDAPSARKLYVKLERDQFYALFGDYDTGLNVTELARYSRSFNGLKSELKSRFFSYNLFASETSQAFVRDEIPGDGTSGLYRLSRRDLIINSEKIVIETRDRFHSEVVVESIPLSRHLDYDIDYDAGTLFFKEPIASRDENFNPIVIVVDYEALDDRDAAVNFGGRVAVHAGDRVEVGASHIHEGANGATGNLTAVDTTVKLGQTRFRAEAATSETEAGIGSTVQGDAYLAEVTHQGKDFEGRLYLREQESGFGLGQQRSSESGSRKIGSDIRYQVNDKFSVLGELARQSMLDSGAQRDLGQAELNYLQKNYTLRTGLRQAIDRTESNEINRSTQLLFGGTWQTSKRLSLHLTHEQAILSQDDSADYPTRTLFGADYLITEKVAIFAEQEFTRSTAQETSMTRAGVKATPWSGAQMQSALEQQGSENGTRVFATTGLKQSWQINEAWSADAGLDRSLTLLHPGSVPINAAAPPASGNREDFTAISLGANRKAEKWSWSNRAEYRISDTEEKIGLFSGAEGEIRRGLALSAKFQLFNIHHDTSADERKGDLRLGAAWRPTQSRWILLDRIDYLFDQSSGDDFNQHNARIINNLNANFRPDRRTQISFQYGAKYVRETINGQNYSGYTDLPGIEGRFDINRAWDIGLRASALHSWSTHQIDYSAGPSVGYRVMKNVWLSVGYNFTGFQDRDFSAADFTAQGPFVKFRFKFDQNSVREALQTF